MAKVELKAGDKVVPLAALATQCAAFAGAASLATVLGRGGVSGLWVLAGVFLGAAAGLLVGLCFGRLCFPASAKRVMVVKAGRAALPRTLFAATVPSFITGMALSLTASLSVGAPPVASALAWAAVCCLAAACIFGLGSALT